MNAQTVGTSYVVGNVNYNGIYTGELRVTPLSIDVTDNSSTIRIDWVYKKNQSDPYGAYNYNSSSVTLFVNGESYSGNADFDLRSSSVGVADVIYTKTVTIEHETDGSKNITIGGTHYTGISWGNKTVNNQTVSLPDVPRSSSFAFSKSTAYMNNSDTIVIGITRASSVFTHKLVYQCGNYKNEYTKVGTSHTFKPPFEWNNAVTNSVSAIATLTLTTYNGNMQIGLPITKNFTVIVPAGLTPSIGSFTASRLDNDVPADWGVYVKGKSGVRLSIVSPSGVYGSRIIAYNISSANYSATSQTAVITSLNYSGVNSFTATITDSRGRTNTKTLSFNVHDYYSPSILSSTQVYRSNSSGVEDNNGSHVTVKPNCAYSGIEGNNAVSIKVNGMTVNNQGTLIIPNVSPDNSYEVSIVATDELSSNQRTYTVASSFSIIDLKHNGKGIAFGGSAEIDSIVEIKGGWKLVTNSLEVEGVEYGNWTPISHNNSFVINSVSYANYVKIGKLVHINALINISPKASNLRIDVGGLPFMPSIYYQLISLVYSGRKNDRVLHTYGKLINSYIAAYCYYNYDTYSGESGFAASMAQDPKTNIALTVSGVYTCS